MTNQLTLRGNWQLVSSDPRIKLTTNTAEKTTLIQFSHIDHTPVFFTLAPAH